MDHIQDVKIIRGLNFKDERGALKKTFFSAVENSLSDFIVKEIWFTTSNKDVIRGMHFQLGNTPGRKLISVISGCVRDVLIDLRSDSTTFNKVIEIELKGEDDLTLFIPAGVAHGYHAKSDKTIVMYVSDVNHIPNDDIGIKWSSIDFNWGVSNPIVSKRDEQLITLEKYLEELL